MNFFTADNLRAAAGGQWVKRPPAGDIECEGVSIDSREPQHARAFIAIRGDRHDGHDHAQSAAEAGARIVFIERDVPSARWPKSTAVVRVESTRGALARMALAYRRTLRTTKVLAVVGSVGKTTTKRMIDAVLRTAMPGSASPKSFNNDIGVPVTILAARPGDRYLIVEIGTNAPGEIAALSAITEPDYVVFTAIGREHLEGLGSLEGVAAENAAVLNCLRPGGFIFANADAAPLRRYITAVSNRVLYGESDDADLRLTDRGMNGTGWFIEVNNRAKFPLALPGRHNAVNALAAVAVGRRMGLDDAKIAAGLACVEGAPMRMAVQRIGPYVIINDAYNANPDSMAAGLEAFGEVAAEAPRRIVVLGDMLELGSDGPSMHREVAGRLLALDRIRRLAHVVLVGELSRHTAAELAAHWPAERFTHVADAEQAAEALISRLRPGDHVFLKASRGIGLERVLVPLRRVVVRAAGACPGGPMKDGTSATAHPVAARSGIK